MARQSATSKPSAQTTGGLAFGPGTGKFLFRIRQTHVRDHYAELIARKAYGAAKLDLVLRAIALLPEHAGKREPGFVLGDWSYEHLHDLAKTAPHQRSEQQRADRETRHLKRKWVSNQMSKLEDRRLVRLEPRPGDRPKIVVLRDNGSGEPFDDPGEASGAGRDLYLTIRGSVIASGALAKWSAAELAAYLAALHAEFHQDRGGGRPFGSDGTRKWWRQLAWFNNANWHPMGRVLLPFSKSLLEEGFNAHSDAGLISRKTILSDPRTRQALPGPRVLYHNHFGKLDQKIERLPPNRYATSVREAS